MSLDEPGVVECPHDCSGRRPCGLSAPDAEGGEHRDTLGELFARMAFLEGASVYAFRILENDLRRHRAPRRLIEAARRAKRDEQRHFRVTRALARRHRADDVARPRCAAPAPRSLEDIATENAREGCVREAFGALVGCWQARTANDPVIRAAMTRIARDEIEHAALAWSVHGWAMGKLPRESRRRVQSALQAEAALVAQGSIDEPAHALVRDAGLPTRAQAAQLARAWIQELSILSQTLRLRPARC